MFPSSKKNRIFYIAKITKENCLKSSIMRSFVSLTSNEINIDGIINYYIQSTPSKTVSSFHSNFFKFKQALCFRRIHRKTKIDSILKKCKSKFFRTIQEALKELLENYIPVPHFPQNFITNINIDLNKRFLHLSLKDILEEFDVSYNFESMLKSVPYFKQEMVIKFMQMSYKELFEKYIESQRFIEDCIVIRKKEGEKFELLFRYGSKIFVQYYSMSKGNKSKNKSKIDYQNSLFNSLQQYSDVSMTEIDSNHKAC